MAIKFAVVGIVCTLIITGGFQPSIKNSYEEEWNKTFGPGSFDDILITDNGYLLIGGAPGREIYECNGRVVEIDKNGNEIWNKTYGKGGCEGFDNAVKVDDGYIIQGATDFNHPEKWSIWVVKIDREGNIVWEKIYGKGGEYWPEDMAGTRDGGVIITGRKIVENTSKIFLLKLNKDGEKEWETTYYYNPGLLPPDAEGVVQTRDGGYAISGEVSRKGVGDRNLLLLKTDEYGNEMWNRTYGDEYESVGGGTIIETSDGGFLLSGMASPGYGPLWYTYLVKTDADGNPQWEHEYHGRKRFGKEEGAGPAIGMVEIPQGYVFITVTAEVGKDGNGWMVKIDKQGNEIWNKTFGNMYGCGFPGNVVADGNSFVACGYWNGSAWVTKCGDYPPPKIKLTYPRPWHIYLFGKEIMPARRTLIIGDITFKVGVDDPLGKINRVEFYVTTKDAYDKDPHYIDYQPPYEWKWNETAIGIRWLYRIIVAAYYGNAGGSEADEIATQVINLGLT